jgi:hypothetical protein
VIGCQDGGLSFFELNSPKPHKSISVKHPITALRMTSHLMVGTEKGSLLIFDFKDGLLIKSIDNLFEGSPIRKIDLLDERYALASSRNRLRIFNPVSS